MSRHSYAGEESPASSPKSTNLISSLLNKLPASFRKKGRSEDDYRSLPPSRFSNNNNKDGDGGSGLPSLEGSRGDALNRPNLPASISEPNGFVSGFSPYRRRAFDDDAGSCGLSLNGAYLNDGTLYYPKTVSPVALELTPLDNNNDDDDDGPPRPPLHYFLVVQLHHLTWCDVCGELIWGLVYQCLRCSYCRFTCHHHCRHLVDVDCHRRGGSGGGGVVEAAAEIRSSAELSTSPTNSNSDDSQASSNSGDSLPRSSSIGYSSAAETSSADSSFHVSSSETTTTTTATGAKESSMVQLRAKGGKGKANKKIRPRLSNDLFSPSRGIFDDYDDSSGDSGHVIATEKELFGGGGGGIVDFDKCGGLSAEPSSDFKYLDRCVETDILEAEEAKNESAMGLTTTTTAWGAKEEEGGGVGAERVSYVGTGGEIWMEGEKCDSCDDEEERREEEEEGEEADSGLDGYVTAKRDLVTVKPGAMKQCEHKQQRTRQKQQQQSQQSQQQQSQQQQSQQQQQKRGKSSKGVKKEESGDKRDKTYAKGSSHQSKHKNPHSVHPSKSRDSANPSHRHHNHHHHRHRDESTRGPTTEKSGVPSKEPPVNVPSVSVTTRELTGAARGAAPPYARQAPPPGPPAHLERSALLPGGQTLNKENLASLVTEFNKRSKGLSLNVLDDGVTVRGFIRVHLDLMRPVNISSDRRLTLRSSASRDSTGKSTMNTERTTFHIPQDTVKNLHVTSETTVKEVVEALLKKYAVTDHPKKFALFEKTLHISDEGKHAVSSRRLHDFECPLLIFLCWGGEMLDQRKFVLQENETGEILWEAFSLPELRTFLRILDHEEREYEREVCEKYRLYQRKLLEEITKHERKQGFSDC